MRVFLTGATGFIGSALAAALRDRGDDVVALVRSPAKASALAVQGCELLEGDLGSVGTLKRGMDGADAVIHAAAIYEVGVREDRWADMLDTNVDGTERVIDAAAFAGVPRIVYVSTVNAVGNTDGAVADEQTTHHGRYVSQYDKTKHMAHEVAERKIAEGVPVIIVMPSAVYGPKDASPVGLALHMFLSGRMPAMVMGQTGLSFVYRDDVVAGILTALDRGRIGEKYILSGDNATLRDFIAVAGDIAGRRPPRFDLPTGVLRAVAPLGPLMGPALGLPPNIREVISAGEATYYATHAKATAELDFHPRPLAQGLRDTLLAEGRL
jgi:nucleoside-diphosphate-sugar epimerase